MQAKSTTDACSGSVSLAHVADAYCHLQLVVRVCIVSDRSQSGHKTLALKFKYSLNPTNGMYLTGHLHAICRGEDHRDCGSSADSHHHSEGQGVLASRDSFRQDAWGGALQPQGWQEHLQAQQQA